MVAAHWMATGTHYRRRAALESPSRTLTLVRLEGNKIVEGWDEYDYAGLMRQLGAPV